MAHYTTYTDRKNELTISWDENGINLSIASVDYLENPTEFASITLDSFDIPQLIEELELYAELLDDKKNKSE